MRRLLTFESHTLTSLSLARCRLIEPGVVLNTIGTCVRLITLVLQDAFHEDSPWISTTVRFLAFFERYYF